MDEISISPDPLIEWRYKMDKDNLALLVLLLICEDLIGTVESDEFDYSEIDYFRISQEFQSFRKLVKQTRIAVSE